MWAHTHGHTDRHTDSFMRTLPNTNAYAYTNQPTQTLAVKRARTRTRTHTHTEPSRMEFPTLSMADNCQKSREFSPETILSRSTVTAVIKKYTDGNRRKIPKYADLWP